MKPLQKLIHLFLGTAVISLFLFSGSALAKSADIAFSETASDMIITALKPEPKNSFLKQLYTQLFCIPVWIKKDKPSKVSQELFDIIKSDKSLERTTNLYQNALSLEEEMHQLYDYPSSIIQKINWEFKMSQLYEEYANYVIYGSINWGALQARLSNLRVSAITAGWITYKPDTSPLQVAENAVLSGSLKKAVISYQVSGGPVNWAQYRYRKTVPYRFAQRPGNKNALGHIKFLFPNQFHVYMHDTPTKYLFKRDKRSYSHGYIRLEKPKLMMETIASFNSSLELDNAEKILKSKKNTYFSLENTIPIDVVYLTAWVDYDGVLQFRDDVYKYDELMIASVCRW